MADETYTPDKLLAGNEFPALTIPGTLAEGNLKRGSVLGVITADGTLALHDKAGTDDGRRTAAYVLAEDCDASAAPAPCVVYETGIFNVAALIFATGTAHADAVAALRTRSIFLRTVRTL